MEKEAGKNGSKPAQTLTKREQRILNSGGGCAAIRRRLDRKAAGLPAEPMPTNRPEDGREFRNLNQYDYDKSDALLATIAGLAELLATL